MTEMNKNLIINVSSKTFSEASSCLFDPKSIQRFQGKKEICSTKRCCCSYPETSEGLAARQASVYEIQRN